MAADVKDAPMKTAASLLTGILGDLQLLVEQQFQLSRCEIEQELRQRANAAFVFGTGVAGCFLSALMASLAVAHLLHWAVQPTETDATATPLWACEAGVAVVLCGLGSLFASLGRRRFRAVTTSQNPAIEIYEVVRQCKIGP